MRRPTYPLPPLASSRWQLGALDARLGRVPYSADRDYLDGWSAVCWKLIRERGLADRPEVA